MHWDERVDILCTGSGLGGLATAIAAVDAGVDVLVADSAGLEVEDAETNRYFGELSQDLCVPVNRAAAVDAPIRDDLALQPGPRAQGRHNALEPRRVLRSRCDRLHRAPPGPAEGRACRLAVRAGPG